MNNVEYIENLLKNYRKNKFRINDIDIEIKEIENFFEGTKGLNISQEKIGPTNKFSSIVENEVIDREKRIDQLNVSKIKLLHDVKRTENLLNYLEGRNKKVIELRYIKGLKWDDISEILEISNPTSIKIKDDSIEKLADLIKY